MSTLTRRGARANAPARLPGIQAERVDDPNVRAALQALREWVEVRLGARGDKFERAVTFRDLEDPLKRIEALEDAAPTSSTTSTASDSDITALKNRVSALETTIAQWQSYGPRILLLEQRLLAALGAIEALDLLTLDEVRAALNVFRANQSVLPIGQRVDDSTLVLDAALSNNFSLEIVGDVHVERPGNLTDGMEFNLIFQMDEAGGHSVTFDSSFDFGVLPVVFPNEPNDIIRVEGYYDAQSGRILCEMHVGYNLIHRAVASFTGSSSLAAFAPYGTAVFEGASTFAAVPTGAGISSGAFSMAGETSWYMQGIYLLVAEATATLAGTSTVSAVGGAGASGAATFAGTSTLTATSEAIANAAATFAGTSTLAAVSYTGAGSHRYWRVSGFQVTGTRLDLSELQFVASGVNLNAPFTYNSQIAPFFGTVNDLFDGTDTTTGARAIWNASDAMAAGFYIGVDFGYARTVSGVKLGGYDTSSRYPTGVTLQYSDNGSTWTTQGSAAGLTWPGNGVLTSEIVMGTAGSHRYWRLTGFTGLSGYLEISEIQWVNSGLKHTTVFTAQAVAGAHSSGSDPAFLKDGNLSTWLGWADTTAENSAFWIKVDLREPGEVDAIKLGAVTTSANHPTQLTVEYSDNDSSWTAAGSASGLTFPGNNTLSGEITF